MLNLVCESCIFATELIIDFAAGGIAVSKLQKTEIFVCRSKPKRGEKMEMKRNVLKVFISLILSLSLLLTTAMVSSFGVNGLETKSENTVYLTDLAAESAVSSTLLREQPSVLKKPTERIIQTV